MYKVLEETFSVSVLILVSSIKKGGKAEKKRRNVRPRTPLILSKMNVTLLTIALRGTTYP